MAFKDGKQFIPSNGTEGCGFVENWCDNCIHEMFNHTQQPGDKQCDILSQSILLWQGDGPKEWIYMNNEPICTDFVRWRWRDDDGKLTPPPPPPPEDPGQLLIPFEFEFLFQGLIRTKKFVYEKA